MRRVDHNDVCSARTRRGGHDVAAGLLTRRDAGSVFARRTRQRLERPKFSSSFSAPWPTSWAFSPGQTEEGSVVSWGLCRMAVRWGWRGCMGRTFLGMLPACEFEAIIKPILY